MRTKNNLFLSGDLLSLNESVIFWRFFIIFNILNVFVQWKNGKFQSPKSSTGTSISVTSLIPETETNTCLSSDLIKFKAVFLEEKSLAISCYQTHESLKVVEGQSTIINFKKHNVSVSRN